MHVEGLLPANVCLVFFFIKLETMFKISTNLPTTRLNGKQNIQFIKRLILIYNDAEASRVYLITV